MDPIGVKKRLEDYESMLQYCILMRTKNKMKDFDAEFEEWCEVVEEYFVKELEKNLAPHKADERIFKHKLEVYHKKIPKFVCGSSTSTKILGQDEEVKVGPNGIAQEEEV
jgi:hypothetical protein